MSKFAVVTGGSSGLGKATLKELQKHGYKCFNMDLNPCSLEGVETLITDVSQEPNVKESASAILKATGGRIDVVINCAGINRIRPFETITPQDVNDLYGVNAFSDIWVAQAFLPALQISEGTILNIISNAHHQPFSNSNVYNGSKAAQWMITRQLAHEVFRRKLPITVFGICPNKLEGPSSEMNSYILKTVSEVNGWTEEQTHKYQLTSLPAGSETSIHTLAEFIGFLLSTKERHRYLAGCILPYGA